MLSRYNMTLTYGRKFNTKYGSMTDRGEENIEAMALSASDALAEAIAHFGGEEPLKVVISRQPELLIPGSVKKMLGIGAALPAIEGGGAA